MEIRPIVLTSSVNPLVTRLALLLALCAPFLAPAIGSANPFMAKAGEVPATVRVATCAVSGGFVHLYTAIDNGTNVRKQPAELYDNSYVEQLSKSGFLKELWGGKLR